MNLAHRRATSALTRLSITANIRSNPQSMPPTLTIRLRSMRMLFKSSSRSGYRSRNSCAYIQLVVTGLPRINPASANRKLPLQPVARIQPRSCCSRNQSPRNAYAVSFPTSVCGDTTPKPGKKTTDCGGTALTGPSVGSRRPLDETKLSPSGESISAVIFA